MSLLNIITLLAIVFIPAGIMFSVWMFIRQRGWGSRSLYSISFAVGLSLVNIVFWFAVRDTSIFLVMEVICVLGGIIFYFSWNTSPMSQYLLNRSEPLSKDSAFSTEAQITYRTQGTRSLIRESLLRALIPYVPLVIGLSIFLLPKEESSSVASATGLFIAGFSGILRILLQPKHIYGGVNSSKSNFWSNVLLVVVLWGSALYLLLN